MMLSVLSLQYFLRSPFTAEISLNLVLEAYHPDGKAVWDLATSLPRVCMPGACLR